MIIIVPIGQNSSPLLPPLYSTSWALCHIIHLHQSDFFLRQGSWVSSHLCCPRTLKVVKSNLPPLPAKCTAAMLEREPRASHMLAKHAASWTTSLPWAQLLRRNQDRRQLHTQMPCLRCYLPTLWVPANTLELNAVCFANISFCKNSKSEWGLLTAASRKPAWHCFSMVERASQGNEPHCFCHLLCCVIFFFF